MRIWISAGETSGDRLAARLVQALRELRSDLEFAGIVGPRLRAEGVLPFGAVEDFSHAGWASVIPRLPRLVGLVLLLRRRAVRWAPDLAVVVDAPGLHRPLLRGFRRAGIRCAWVAPPQLWAWRDRVVPELRGLASYPLHRFELECQEQAGSQAKWLGYPGERPAEPSMEIDRDVLALLPGSRAHWRVRHEALFRRAADEANLPLVPLVAIPDDRTPRAGEGRISELLPRAALALALPGTGVLETALAGVPTVVAAHPGVLDRFMARGRLSGGNLSLPNRILGESVLPEFLGTPGSDELAQALRTLWERRDEAVERIAPLRALLGDPDANRRIAADLLAIGGVPVEIAGRIS